MRFVFFFAGRYTSGGTSHGQSDSVIPRLGVSTCSLPGWCTEFPQPFDFPHDLVSNSKGGDIHFLQHSEIQFEENCTGDFMTDEVLCLIWETSVGYECGHILRRPLTYLS